MNKGDIVLFNGCTDDQQRWGNHYGDYKKLVKRKYEIEAVEVHSWHTKIWLKGIKGCFNSVCFELIEPTNKP